MAARLGSLAQGTNVFIDTNIFIYGVTGKSAECRTLLERCSREEISGISLFEVVHEATHKFMMAEAQALGFFRGTDRGAKYLSKHPQLVKTLTAYWTQTSRLLQLNVLFVPMDRQILTEARAERANTGLLTNDSLILAAMHHYGIVQLATNDQQFETVAGISVFSASDLLP